VAKDKKSFTLNELKKFDGKGGRPAYIAYKGKVYDVTDSSLWLYGDHIGQHSAGRDLTDELSEAPHGAEEFKKIKEIGVLD